MMLGALSEDLFRWLTLLSVAGTLGFARYYGFTFIFPLFSWMEVRGPLRFAIAIGLSLPSAVMVHQLLREGGMPSPGLWAALMVKEAAVGMALGSVMGLPFWAMQGVGDTIDVYRGASAANLFDPVNAQEMTISGKFLVMFSLTLFAALGGIGETVDLLLRSQRAWPVLALSPPFEIATLKGFGEVALKALMIAVALGAPLLIALLLVDVALVFAVRGARSFNVYDLTNAARGLMLVLVLPVYVTLFARHFPDLLRPLLRLMSDLVTALGR